MSLGGQSRACDVCEYGNVDLSVIYDTIKNDIPELLEELEAITV